MEVINCISAESLKKRQQDYISVVCQEQLRNIGKKLEQAATGFNNSIYIDTLYPTVRQELEKLGYTVQDCSSQKDGPCFVVKW